MKARVKLLLVCTLLLVGMFTVACGEQGVDEPIDNGNAVEEPVIVEPEDEGIEGEEGILEPEGEGLEGEEGVLEPEGEGLEGEELEGEGVED